MWSRVLVNGDDLAFRAPRGFSAFFEEAAKDVGFKLSLGKNYISPDVIMINSQMFRRIDGHLKRIGYLNQTLVYGKLGSSAKPTEIGRDISSQVGLVPWTRCVVPLCFKRWKADWFGPIYQPNWYMPVHLGGFGVDKLYAPPGWKPTYGQRKIAARFVSDPRLCLYRKKGMDIQSSKLAGALAHWRLVPKDHVLLEHETEEVDDGWLGRLAYAARAAWTVTETSDKVMIARFFDNVPLKPISMERLNELWDCRLVASGLPVCPPIGPLKLPEGGGEKALALMGVRVPAPLPKIKRPWVVRVDEDYSYREEED